MVPAGCVRTVEKGGETAARGPLPSKRTEYEWADGAASDVVSVGDGASGTVVAIADSNDNAVVVPGDCVLESGERLDGVSVVQGEAGVTVGAIAVGDVVAMSTGM